MLPVEVLPYPHFDGLRPQAVEVFNFAKRPLAADSLAARFLPELSVLLRCYR